MEFSEYYFYIKTNIKGDFQIWVSVPLSAFVSLNETHMYTIIQRTLKDRQSQAKLGSYFLSYLPNSCIGIYTVSHFGENYENEHILVYIT